ncbi:NADP-dependent glyceraldehyde-3-phosphate dehydrogenase [Malacoplasma penetrans]|uniref:NADP-dependent glyceraldehyde-3-phosphate dehydrogenase n=1 Tax=Malacoplasma penetrans (strain HF-2) TaxID=272633 RepID=Q8EVT9_MALP2|nr:NADP-dependent glyceraldehyde-3-phosphate dehydrogenase [Malacoplasma penetrans]RXY97260.1 NADP-dependent glyceraldehyde-3-phosphate dehydrogenase [Malacoplasma penetrans]BAC44260.1 NADP-dependent glyceraldehyde-3-phosphate dehydrogenase [Malacoplasma penetrans HF-2]
MENTFYKGSAYINGKFVDSEKTIPVISTIDGSTIGSVAALSKKDIDMAFEGAHLAFNLWRNLTPEMRIKKIKEFAEYFIAEKEFLATLMSYEIGKSYNDALKEVERSYENIFETIEVYEKEFVNPSVIGPEVNKIKGKTGYFYNVPVGVVLAIAPFNYPINLGLAKIIPTLLVGNTIVFKPATQGSLVSSQLAKYFDQANFIAGVFNLVTGKGSEIGDYILENKRIQGATFTGSSDIGFKLASKLPMKPLVLELGGKDAAIVTNNADVELAAKEIIKGAFGYSGQRCTAIKRVLVTKEIADDLLIHLIKEAQKLKVGNPLNNPDITPLIDRKAVDFNIDLIDDAINHGANLVYGGNIEGYNLLRHTILDNVSTKSKLAWEEPFGPVLPIIRVSTINEAIAIANASEYGLQGSVFTKDLEEARTIAKYLDTGTVNINRGSSRGPDIFPFIGIKKSGFGVQGIRDSLKAMTRVKGIVENE